MNSILKISVVYRQKIPSLKVDIVQNLDVPNLILPRKTYFPGHFHLKTIISAENRFSNRLIF